MKSPPSTVPPALPPSINFDIVLKELLHDMADVADCWANGSPKDETALLNRITERLSRKRRKCDVGTTSPVIMTAELYELHRRGKRQTDKYGADLAVTISINNPNGPKPYLLKTALFQLKIASAYKITLDSDQLMDSLIPFPVKHRSFVLAIDGNRLGYRVHSTLDCLESINSRGTKTFSTNDWEFLSQWLLGWFSCQRGQASDPDDPRSAERLLDAYRIGHPEAFADQALRENEPDKIPARSWLRYNFRQTETSSQYESETLV